MIKKIKEIVLLAGEIVQEGFAKPKNIRVKTTDIDVVTEYDTRVEEFLKEQFEIEFPDFVFLGEESDNVKDQKTNNLKNFIIVDPIDGTTNFVKGFPYVGISVAVYKDAKPFYGVVYNPILKEYYEALSGSGESFCNGESISVYKGEQKKQLCAVYKSARKINPTQEELDVLDALSEEYLEQRRLHSAALECCYVAKGIYGLYAVNNIKPWDVAAGMIIAKEAGAHISDIYHNPIDDILSVNNIKISVL
jgi:myo-inositol-1(or 4)-monophosphatase